MPLLSTLNTRVTGLGTGIEIAYTHPMSSKISYSSNLHVHFWPNLLWRLPGHWEAQMTRSTFFYVSELLLRTYIPEARSTWLNLYRGGDLRVNRGIGFTFPTYMILEWLFSSRVHNSFGLGEFCSYSVVQLSLMTLALKYIPMTSKDIFQYVFEIMLSPNSVPSTQLRDFFLCALSEIIVHSSVFYKTIRLDSPFLRPLVSPAQIICRFFLLLCLLGISES